MTLNRSNGISTGAQELLCFAKNVSILIDRTEDLRSKRRFSKMLCDSFPDIPLKERAIQRYITEEGSTAAEELQAKVLIPAAKFFGIPAEVLCHPGDPAHSYADGCSVNGFASYTDEILQICNDRKPNPHFRIISTLPTYPVLDFAIAEYFHKKRFGANAPLHVVKNHNEMAKVVRSCYTRSFDNFTKPRLTNYIRQSDLDQLAHEQTVKAVGRDTLLKFVKELDKIKQSELFTMKLINGAHLVTRTMNTIVLKEDDRRSPEWISYRKEGDTVIRWTKRTQYSAQMMDEQAARFQEMDRQATDLSFKYLDELKEKIQAFR